MTTTTTTDRRGAAPAAFTAVQAPTPILVDLFPAEVQLPPPPPANATTDAPVSKIYPARVIITADPTTTEPDTLYVFADSSAGPALIYSAPLSARTGSNREGSALTADPTPDVITFTKAGGCGCGSALKSFAPFSRPYSVA